MKTMKKTIKRVWMSSYGPEMFSYGLVDLQMEDGTTIRGVSEGWGREDRYYPGTEIEVGEDGRPAKDTAALEEFLSGEWRNRTWASPETENLKTENLETGSGDEANGGKA